VELKKVRQFVGDKVCLVGNIDCARLLPHGTPDQVREAVRQAIAAAPGGGYIFTSSNSIHSSCRPENFLAMVRACQEFGKY
jgi:uroporphyrinogen decarboxylase